MNACLSRKRRNRVPPVLQMEDAECGAASLCALLALYGRHVPLERLRQECGVSRDGAKASSLVRVARRYGMQSKGYRRDIDALWVTEPPFIVFWNFNHFLVVEGWDGEGVYLSDPARGPRKVAPEDFDAAYTGVLITCRPGPGFQKGGKPPSTLGFLRERLAGERTAVLAVVVLGVLLALPRLMFPGFLRLFVDRLLIEHAYSWWRLVLAGLLMLIVGQGLLAWLREHVLHRLEKRLSRSLSSGFLRHLLRLPVGFFQQRAAGEIVSRARLGDRVAHLLTGRLAASVLDLPSIGLYAALMLWYDVSMTAVAVLGAAASLGLILRFVHSGRDAYYRAGLEDGKRTGMAMGGLRTLETRKAHGAERDFVAAWSERQMQARRENQRLRRGGACGLVLPRLLLRIAALAILGLGGLRIMQGEMTVGDWAAFQCLTLFFLAPVDRLALGGEEIGELDSHVRRLADVERNELLSDPAGTDTALARSLDASARLTGSITLRNVTFGYSPMAPPLLENVSFHVEPGQRVSLVGPPGCGASTLAKLIAGLHAPWSGEILFDGRSRDACPREMLARSVALAGPEAFLFSGTFRDNLTFWDDEVPESALWAAARDARIDGVISARPGGLDAPVAEGGANLSGEERLRLALARSLVRDPSILILDGVLDALESRTRREVELSLRRRGCTCIVVGQAPDVAHAGDEIIVLERGGIVARGSHETLLARGGVYTALAKADESA